MLNRYSIFTNTYEPHEWDGWGCFSRLLKYLSVNCTFRPSAWRSVVGNLQFFDPQVEAFCGDKRRPFLGEGKTKIFFKFFDCRSVFAAHSVFNIFGYWLRWIFKCSRLSTPGVLVKYINIGAQGLGSDPRAGQIRRSVANCSLRLFRGFLGSKLYYTGANKVTVAEMGPATRYTLLRITVSIIEV